MLLDNVSDLDLKSLSSQELIQLSNEIRNFISETILSVGGHLSSNLGVIELTVALHHCFNFPVDKLIFDVGHQSYTHKILSGRYTNFNTIRQKNGLSGFSNPEESDYDIAMSGHAGTSLSTMMGIQKSYQLLQKHLPFIISMVGDSSISNGTSFEALNLMKDLNLKKSLIILNDNQMSISSAVGSLSDYLIQLTSSPRYNKWRSTLKKQLKFFGNKTFIAAEYLHKHVHSKIEYLFFKYFGIRYFGPIDGHNIVSLVKIFNNIKQSSNLQQYPIILHILTKKGKGNKLAEEFPDKYHGVGKLTISTEKKSKVTYSEVFANKLLSMQEKYGNITVTTAGMVLGTGLLQFSKTFPKNYFDVGIAEGHAVAFSSFLSYTQDIKPYIAIYSTFLQRSLDHIFQEVILQKKCNPVFIIDRAGFVGEDGASHQGFFDIAYLKFFPDIIMMSPINSLELEAMLEWSYHQPQTCFIRYPKDRIVNNFQDQNSYIIEKGKGSWVLKNSNAQMTILSYGSIINEILNIQDQLPSFNLINLRFAKPLDIDTIDEAIELNLPLLSIEEHSIIGGLGESIAAHITSKTKRPLLHIIGVPDKLFYHATRKEQLEEAGLSGTLLKQNILNFLESAV